VLAGLHVDALLGDGDLEVGVLIFLQIGVRLALGWLFPAGSGAGRGSDSVGPNATQQTNNGQKGRDDNFYLVQWNSSL